MPVCIRCNKKALIRGDYLGWILVTKKGARRVTLGDVRMSSNSFFDEQGNMVWEGDGYLGLCPDCQIRKTYETYLVKRINPVIEALDLNDLIEICGVCYPDFKYDGHKLISDNTN